MNVEDRWQAEPGGVAVVFGPGALEQLGERARAVGGKHVLLVTDAGLRRAGHVDRALEVLRDANVRTAVFDGVEENPTTRHVGAAVECAKTAGIDCIVALGGGSSMDCAKGTNFLLTNGGRMEDYQGRDKAKRAMLPSIGVPTTAGTGSEAQSYALIAQEGTRIKMACGDRKARFVAVILDPLLATTAPRDVIAASGLDAVSHALESYVTECRTPVSQMFAREAWRLVEGGLDAALTTPDRPEVWGRMLLGAHLGGTAIEHSMLGAAHACANPLTARFGITHGIAVALMLPAVIRFNTSHVGALYEELREAGGGALIEERVERLRTVAGLPGSLRDCSVPRDCLPELAAMAANQWTAGFNPRPVGQADLLELYESSF